MWLPIFFFICTPLWGMVSSRQFITCWNWILHLMSFVTSLSPNIKRLLLQLKRGQFSFFFFTKPSKKYTSDYFWVTEMLFSIFFSWFVLALIPVRWVCIRDVKCVGLFAFLHHPIGKFGSNSNSQKMDAWISVDGAFGSPRPNPMQKRGHGVIGCSYAPAGYLKSKKYKSRLTSSRSNIPNA